MPLALDLERREERLRRRLRRPVARTGELRGRRDGHGRQLLLVGHGP